MNDQRAQTRSTWTRRLLEDRRWMNRLLLVAAVCAIVALLLMIWSFFSTTPLGLVVFMTVGQALGTLSFVAFLLVVGVDLYRARVFDPTPPATGASEAAGERTGGEG